MLDDYREYVAQMRQAAPRDNFVMQISKELWLQIAEHIESQGNAIEDLEAKIADVPSAEAVDFLTRRKKMANEKLLRQVGIINRALGMIEGVSYGMEQSAGQALADAVQMIDETVKEMLDEKAED